MAAVLASNRGFAKGARGFASGSSRRGRAARLVAGGSLVAVVSGPFGTSLMPLLPRSGFWLALLALNFALWEAWFTLLGRRGWPWRRTLLAGLPLCLLALPFEVDLALRMFAGVEAASRWGVLWRGAAVAGVLALAIFLFVGRAMRQPAADARFPGSAARLADIAALAAEDHYVRLHLADGRSLLLLMRFSDAVAAMAGRPGQRIHRGAWVADRHRGPAECRNRRWFVRAAGGVSLPVSRSRVAALRQMGWLAREG